MPKNWPLVKDWGNPDDASYTGIAYSLEECVQMARYCHRSLHAATKLDEYIYYKMATEWWVRHAKAKRKERRKKLNGTIQSK